MLEHIHSKRCKGLVQKQLNNLDFVHYNLQLHNKQFTACMNGDAIELSKVDPILNWIIELHMDSAIPSDGEDRGI